jgi:hypothetical protein
MLPSSLPKLYHFLINTNPLPLSSKTNLVSSTQSIILLLSKLSTLVNNPLILWCLGQLLLHNVDILLSSRYLSNPHSLRNKSARTHPNLLAPPPSATQSSLDPLPLLPLRHCNYHQFAPNSAYALLSHRSYSPPYLLLTLSISHSTNFTTQLQQDPHVE